MDRTRRYDAVMAGGGLAGLSLALALRQGLGDGARLAVADPAFVAEKPHSTDMRASAIAAGARRLFEALGVWDRIAGEAEPILAMEITDSKLGDAARPVFLSFEGDVEPGEPFAHMVPNALLQDAMTELARERGIELLASPVARFTAKPGSVALAFSDGSEASAALLAACDGARSKLRALAGIGVTGWPYGQSAIVMTVGHERPHGGKAVEHFLPAGPFALLPLTGNRCSIVWTESTATAKSLLALPRVLLKDELERRFGLELGEIEILDDPKAFPLGFQMARAFVAERLALVGDAAHTIHPIAGQGINMGLRDVAALAEAVTDAARLGLDIGSPDVLARYQRWRRFDTLAMGMATDGLNRLFGIRSDAVRLVRDVGLGLVERMPAMKSFFIRDAAGIGGQAPKLLRGETL
ncbi:Ubiquinone biosynthesis hydroxylase, UbiH/UbiF/VisC/COQ6 family [Ancylobacter novellus DSM 506]|uniref:Ubiquinone biosynthesis hydroxylase, UbiH/UbiF/VisC/COQ6 family n=1 Tax=Ancylobacter novellus (strain ATCC 8093 / DSM 506 / JCM 20403 / CCM 1077 / IAM 12100 / NBRC 12443 / NCIMB 10456) TaxID=639283 RepID=D7A9D0_ANCN5|nr:ubiquinone biosynthesis hydroxylase [Ancylobacter novellus]ADH90692.1 Ubiquinone biosynthesis hydroxylase, UbiH/UbiF/VisC/COQ6 family [Ancylobacter novellus DSM 506]